MAAEDFKLELGCKLCQQVEHSPWELVKQGVAEVAFANEGRLGEVLVAWLRYHAAQNEGHEPAFSLQLVQKQES